MSEEHNPDEATEQKNSVNRRRFVKSLSATGVASAGFSNIASATPAETVDREKIDSLVRNYQTRSDVSSAVKEHCQDTIEILGNRGFIDRSSISELLDLSRLDLDEYTQANEGWHVNGTQKEGIYTGEIFIKTQNSTHTTEIFVQPEVGLGYAHCQSIDNDGSDIKLIGNPRTDITLQDESSGDIITLAYPCGCCCRKQDSACYNPYPTGRQIRRKYCTASASYCGGYTNKCCSTLLGC